MTAIDSRVTEFEPSLSDFLQHLQETSHRLGSIDQFPEESIRRCARLELAFMDDSQRMLKYYVALAFGCMTTAFIMTQRFAALRRLQTSLNIAAQSRWLECILAGDDFTTIGISHLTTSRQYCQTPSLTVQLVDRRWILNGSAPWVTGAAHASMIVVGAVEASDAGSTPATSSQYLFAVPTNSEGVRCGRGLSLLALTSSCTDVAQFDNVRLTEDDLIHGPSDHVIATSSPPGSGAGGLQTSAIALGLAARAIKYLILESKSRPMLNQHIESLQQIWDDIYAELTDHPAPNAIKLRKRANDLALQSSQAALATAKGAGYVEGHEVGNWCREALFFLVWSCPQAVVDAHLRGFSQSELL